MKKDMLKNNGKDYIFHYIYDPKRLFFVQSDIVDAVVEERIRRGSFPQCILVDDDIYARLLTLSQLPDVSFPYHKYSLLQPVEIRGIPVFLYKEFDNKDSLEIYKTGYKQK